jgi:hypothetical protein
VAEATAVLHVVIHFRQSYSYLVYIKTTETCQEKGGAWKEMSEQIEKISFFRKVPLAF